MPEQYIVAITVSPWLLVPIAILLQTVARRQNIPLLTRILIWGNVCINQLYGIYYCINVAMGVGVAAARHAGAAGPSTLELYQRLMSYPSALNLAWAIIFTLIIGPLTVLSWRNFRLDIFRVVEFKNPLAKIWAIFRK